MGENHFAAYPVALYGTVLLLAGFAYFILERALVASQGQDSALEQAVGKDFKAKLSVALYLVAIVLACRWPRIACSVYVFVALLWLVPDRRIEKKLTA